VRFDLAVAKRNLMRSGDFASSDLIYYRNECAALQGEVALLRRENAALRARVEPLERRVVELELKDDSQSSFGSPLQT
jgi:BMFP domain-containing protein YqiC